LKSKKVTIPSDLLDTDYAQVHSAQACMDEMERIFPWYKRQWRDRRESSTKQWEIHNTIDRVSRTILPTLEDVRDKVYNISYPMNDYEQVLVSGRPILEEGFDVSLLEQYQAFWFSDPLDFVMTLGAMKSLKILSLNDYREHSWTNDGRRTTVSADMNGDFQMEQRSIWQTINVSPFWWIVPFKPMDNNAFRTFYHTEGFICAIVLSYIESLWITQDIFWEGYEKLRSDLEEWKVELGPYGNAWDYDESATYMQYEIFKTGVPKVIDWVSMGIKSNPVTDKDGKGYCFYIWNDDKLYIYEWERGNQQPFMIFDEKDAEQIVRWIISNTKKGIWRTWVWEIAEHIKCH